ncbi:MAG: multifunctional CCA tRNA nucleotidyl transferase/2'3'-cyclic phosphodiesterase/2'nucleotidase/phosphatase [Gammaproteobacteria bacterium]|nr:multifunctional CCA tRNA nucleotidyl transferase/2'3'-cyclic phosphodiesterase/2'nucleotidase/phosphatase [Gammaproteobacteria bacterium]
MQIYLVGGAIRDELLDLPVHELDWVVVGSSPQEMLAQGFIAVGKDFPVFLHPKTHEEYALARTERKVAKGYKGFAFHADPTVSLEEDLKRRDLTINAIAKNEQGELIDPYGGQIDLANKLLRHVSPAFAEDPVRILRAARFACRLIDFSVFPDTNKLMQTMVEAGEVDALVPERVWQEFKKALHEIEPWRFFEVLNDCGALKKLFPEINIENDGFGALKCASALTTKATVRFASLLYDLKPETIKKFCRRLRVNNEYCELALLTVKCYPLFAELDKNNPQQILKLLHAADAGRRRGRFDDFLLITRAINDNEFAEKSQLLHQALDAINNIDLEPLIAQQLPGPDFAKALNALKLQTLMQLLNVQN